MSFMYKVFTGDGRQYVGCSESMAEQFYLAAVSSGRCVLMKRRGPAGQWLDVKEHTC